MSTSSGRRIKLESEPSKSDINKLLSFTENPKKYATGTGKAKEKVDYLDDIKYKFSEGQLGAYTKARKKYDVLVATRQEPRIQKSDHGAILADAFNNQRSVKIRYKGSWRIIDPYSLNKTYVVAYCHSARDIRTFRVDRIQGAELSGAFSVDKTLQATAQSRIVEAPSYKGYGKYRRRY